MVKILVTDGIENTAKNSLLDLGYDVVEKFFEPEDLKIAIRDFDAVVVRSATKISQSIIDGALETGRLKLVLRGGVGIDNIDAEYAKEKGIHVKNTPAASSSSVAELAISHMFNLARFLHISNHTMRIGEWNKKQYVGIELGGKVLGLLGFGRIAREVALRGRALGMKILYHDKKGKFFDNDFESVSFEDLIRSADFLSLHIPGSKDKKPIITKKEIEWMKDGAYLINTARGEIVCEDSLLTALDSGKLSGAGLDVYLEEPTKNERLYTHPNVSLTPHIGASTKEAQERIGEEIVNIIQGFFG
jgi:D-3-phosphoglycerate dehydrogenase / 2-oxoglutarate reductase